jgi:uncharacterized protein HemX
MPRITMPGRASRTAGERTAETKPIDAAKPGNGAEPTTATKEAKPDAGRPDAATPSTVKPDAAKPAEGALAPQPNLQERIEGLQGWMAEMERKQARLTYFGGLLLLLALGAAGAALYFGLTAHSDSATKNDLDSLTNRVNSLQGAVTKNSKDTQNALNASIAQLQQSIGNVQKQQSQASANISTLQSQVAAGALNNKNATTPGVTPTAPGAAPGATTTTPNAGNGKNP